jgi:hypothetical protein
LPASAGAASLRLASISRRGFPAACQHQPARLPCVAVGIANQFLDGAFNLSVGARLHGDRAAEFANQFLDWAFNFIRGGAASWRSRGGLANQFLDGASIYPWGRGELIRHTFPNHNICFKIHISCFLRHLATK